MHEWFEYIYFFIFKGENCVLSHKIKSDQRVLQKNLVDTFGAPVFAPGYSTTVLALNALIERE